MRPAPHLPRLVVTLLLSVGLPSAGFALVLAAPRLHAETARISRSDADLMTSLVATAASRDARLDVLTRADIQQAMNLAADQQMMSCDAAAGACLAELAQAMNATSVLHGSIGTLGDDVALTLSLFDTSTARAIGRTVAQAHDVGGLGAKVDATVAALLSDLPAAADGARIRIVVLDLEIAGLRPGADASSPTPPPAPPTSSTGGAATWTRVGGAAVLAIGAVAGGFALDSEKAFDDAQRALDAADTPAARLPALVTDRDAAANDARLRWGLAAGAAVVGAGLMFVPFAWGE